MGMTQVQHYFMQIIGHISVNVHRIPTELGTEICFNEPLHVPKVNLIRAHIGVL